MTDNDADSESFSAQIGYAIAISESIHKKIDQLILILNKLDDRSHSKKSWVLEAIKEKLHTDDQLSEVSREKYLKLQMSTRIREKIEDKVEYIKQFRQSYSKKKWILEAIFEKLEREECKAVELKVNFKNSLSELKKS